MQCVAVALQYLRGEAQVDASASMPRGEPAGTFDRQPTRQQTLAGFDDADAQAELNGARR